MANAVPIRRNPLGQGPLAGVRCGQTSTASPSIRLGKGRPLSSTEESGWPVFFISTAEPALQINH